MGQILHGSATTTEAVRRAIQISQASLRALAKHYGINQKTVAKWKKREAVCDLPTGSKAPRSTVLSIEDEAIVGALIPRDVAGRTETLNWLFWQMGSAPYLGGGFGHFYAYAPTKIEYAIDRFAMEVKRQLDVLDRRLAETQYLAGNDYSIADIASFTWYGSLARSWLYYP